MKYFANRQTQQNSPNSPKTFGFCHAYYTFQKALLAYKIYTHKKKWMHTFSLHSLIWVHLSHSTMIWSRKTHFSLSHTQMFRYSQMSFSFASSRWHDTHTHTFDQRPCPGNLFQAICAAVGVGQIVSCVCNVSEAVIQEPLWNIKISLSSIHTFGYLLPLSPSASSDTNVALFTPAHPLPTFTPSPRLPTSSTFSLLSVKISLQLCVWTEVCLSAGFVDTLTTRNYLEVPTQTVTQSKYSYRAVGSHAWP